MMIASVRIGKYYLGSKESIGQVLFNERLLLESYQMNV